MPQKIVILYVYSIIVFPNRSIPLTIRNLNASHFPLPHFPFSLFNQNPPPSPSPSQKKKTKMLIDTIERRVIEDTILYQVLPPSKPSFIKSPITYLTTPKTNPLNMIPDPI